MKQFKLFFALFAMLALGVGNAWGAEKTVSWTATTNSLGSAISAVNGTATGTIKTGDFVWNYTRTLVSLKSGKSDYVAMSNGYMQLGSSNAGETLQLTTSNIPGTIKSVAVDCWSKNGAHNLTISVGGTSYYSGATPSSGNTKSGTGTSSGTIDIKFTISKNNALYVKSITVIYEEALGDGIVETLKSISVEGMTTTYEQGDAFEFDGTCTATYAVTKNDVAQEDKTIEVIPTVSTPDMTVVGTQTITVSYTDGDETATTTYTINITENVVTPGTYTGNLNNVFFGCATGNNATEQSGKFNDVLVVAGCQSSASSKTNYQSNHVRFYADSYLTISVPEGYVINSIVFTAGGDWNGSISVNAGTYTNDTKSWAGSAQEVVFSFGAQNRIATATVTYAAAGDTPETPDTPEEPETPVVPENLGAKTIAEFLALKNTTDTCVLTGVVANIANTTYGNFDLVDATGSVYVYGLLTAAGESKQFASMDIAAGDTLTVKAIYNEYNSKPQAKNAIYVSHTKTATPVVPENLGAKTIAEFLALKNTTDTCVLTGVVANIANTEYGNFDLVDATGSVYVYGLLTAAGVSKQFASMDIAAGDTLTVKAIYNEFNSNPQAKNAIYVSHSKLVLTVKVTSENGTVDGLADGGKYVRGTEVILTATAAEGYEFVNWTVGEEVVSTENPYTFTVTADVALVANFAVVEPEVIAYELNGGELPTATVPTQEELWASFKTATGLDTKALSELSSPVLNTIAGLLKGTTWYEGFDVLEWKWLKSYIQTIQANQAGQQFVDANGTTRTVVELKDDISSDDNWRFAVAAFFAQSQYVGWPTATADFTEAGKPEAWGAAYQAAHAVVLPTEPVDAPYTLPTPVKEGYTFVGWYDNAEGTGEAYTVIPAGWSGTLYAIWEAEGPATALDNIAIEGKVVKTIINGQLIIVKDGVQFNAQGQVIR